MNRGKHSAGGAPQPAARMLAEFCGELTWESIPRPTRERTAELVLDLLAVASRGSNAGPSRAVREYVAGQPAGGATVLGRYRSTPPSRGDNRTKPDARLRRGTVLRASPPWAALANGTSAHALEMDDVTTQSSLHPGASVIPAALASAEERAVPGTRVLEAIVAGYEVTIRVGNALGGGSVFDRGFHPTGVAGVFGAAIAAGKVLGLDGAQLERAIGIAATMASGSLEFLSDGSWTKRLNPGWAAHSGVVAAGLAARGFTGPATALEGQHGLLRGYTDKPEPGRLTEDLSTANLRVTEVSTKPYGCSRYSHGLIDAVLALRRAHFSGAASRPAHEAIDDVARVRLGIASAAWSLIADGSERTRKPRDAAEAQVSAAYAAAVALVYGRAGLREFEQDVIEDPRLRTILERTECYRDPSLDAGYPHLWPADVEIHLRDGRVLRQRVDHALGSPENPIKRDALIDRFVLMTFPVESGDASDAALEARVQGERSVRTLAERILRLEEEADLTVLESLAQVR